MRSGTSVSLAAIVTAGLAVAMSTPPSWAQTCDTSCAASERDAQGCCPAKPTPSTPGGMVKIPAGKFMMGSPEAEAGRANDETQHEVTLTRPFLLMRREVTQGELQALGGVNTNVKHKCDAYQGVSMLDPSYPATCVSWEEAAWYANELSRKEGLPDAYYFYAGVSEVPGSTGYRLPTEAEWEWAARGGRTTPWGGPTGAETEVCALGNIADATGKTLFSLPTVAACNDGVAGLARVGSYAANGYGLHDMAGNAWEWVQDWADVYPTGPVTDPKGPAEANKYFLSKVRRGGSWASPPASARIAKRGHAYPESRAADLGFRLARSIPSSP